MVKSVAKQRALIVKQQHSINEIANEVNAKHVKRSKRIRRKKKNRKLPLKGITDKKVKYYRYLRSIEWAKIKIELYEIRGRKCEYCGSKTKI